MRKLKTHEIALLASAMYFVSGYGHAQDCGENVLCPPVGTPIPVPGPTPPPTPWPSPVPPYPTPTPPPEPPPAGGGLSGPEAPPPCGVGDGASSVAGLSNLEVADEFAAAVTASAAGSLPSFGPIKAGYRAPSSTNYNNPSKDPRTVGSSCAARLSAALVAAGDSQFLSLVPATDKTTGDNPRLPANVSSLRDALTQVWGPPTQTSMNNFSNNVFQTGQGVLVEQNATGEYFHIDIFFQGMMGETQFGYPPGYTPGAMYYSGGNPASNTTTISYWILPP